MKKVIYHQTVILLDKKIWTDKVQLYPFIAICFSLDGIDAYIHFLYIETSIKTYREWQVFLAEEDILQLLF